MKFHLPEAVHTERGTSVFGALVFDFPAGDVTPADAAEEHALEHLVRDGLATLVEDAPVDWPSPESDESADQPRRRGRARQEVPE